MTADRSPQTSLSLHPQPASNATASKKKVPVRATKSKNTPPHNAHIAPLEHPVVTPGTLPIPPDIPTSELATLEVSNLDIGKNAVTVPQFDIELSLSRSSYHNYSPSDSPIPHSESFEHSWQNFSQPRSRGRSLSRSYNSYNSCLDEEESEDQDRQSPTLLSSRQSQSSLVSHELHSSLTSNSELAGTNPSRERSRSSSHSTHPNPSPTERPHNLSSSLSTSLASICVSDSGVSVNPNNTPSSSQLLQPLPPLALPQSASPVLSSAGLRQTRSSTSLSSHDTSTHTYSPQTQAWMQERERERGKLATRSVEPIPQPSLHQSQSLSALAGMVSNPSNNPHHPSVHPNTSAQTHSTRFSHDQPSGNNSPLQQGVSGIFATTVSTSSSSSLPHKLANEQVHVPSTQFGAYPARPNLRRSYSHERLHYRGGSRSQKSQKHKHRDKVKTSAQSAIATGDLGDADEGSESESESGQALPQALYQGRR